MIAAPPAHPRFIGWLPWLAGALSLLPFIVCFRSFADLWWFGDDWDLLDQIARVGFWHWTFRPFAENFEPLFKLLWGGLVLGGRGSYFSMIAALWLTHALNVALLARLLLRTGFAWPGTTLAAAGLGLSAANLETLSWSVQWSAVLALLFFLLAASWQLSHRFELAAWSWRFHGILVLLVSASALSFSRGVLTGTALALITLIPLDGAPVSWASRLRTATICLGPALAVTAVIFFAASGNQHDVGNHGREIMEFGVYYWCSVPLHRLLEFVTWGPRTTLLLGIVKLVAIAWALRHSAGTQRWLLVLLLVFDLGNAVLLGIGRYHTGLPAANSLRYQYTSLLCTLPFFARCLDGLLARVRSSSRVGVAATAGILLVFTAAIVRKWPAEIHHWSGDHGREIREAVFRRSPPPGAVLVDIPWITIERANELTRIYHLH